MSRQHLPDRFEVLETLRSGGGETLLRARDRTLGREVLLKISSALSPGPDVDRSLREAKMLARVNHPGVARLWEVLNLPQGIVLVLEPVNGECLSDRLARHAVLPVDDVRRLGHALAGALSAIHAVGVVHRDISIPNIFLKPDDTPVLAGFGFAKPSDPSGGSSIDYRAWAAGRAEFPGYPAPEQVAGQPADARSDCFGLGCVLFRALTGREAYPEGTSGGAAPDPMKLRPDCPPDLARAIQRCLAPSPAQRFQSANEAGRALDSTAVTSPTPRARSRSLAPMAGAAALVGAAVVVFALLQKDAPSDRGVVGNTSRGRAVTTERGPLAPRYEHSYALLIGIGPSYQATPFRALPNAERDVTALEERLVAMPWEAWNVRHLVGTAATADSIRRALADLCDRARPDDRVFVYYAGHGERHPRVEESGWIIPVDAVPLDQDPSRKNWYRFDEFEKFFAECAAKHIFIALDCCYSGIGVMATREASSRPYADAFLTRKAHVLLASSREDEPALDGPPRGHSPFAGAFLDALGEKGPLTSTELGLLVQKRLATAGFPQTPLLGHHTSTAPDRSEFVFFRDRPR